MTRSSLTGVVVALAPVDAAAAAAAAAATDDDDELPLDDDFFEPLPDERFDDVDADAASVLAVNGVILCAAAGDDDDNGDDDDDDTTVSIAPNEAACRAAAGPDEIDGDGDGDGDGDVATDVFEVAADDADDTDDDDDDDDDDGFDKLRLLASEGDDEPLAGVVDDADDVDVDAAGAAAATDAYTATKRSLLAHTLDNTASLGRGVNDSRLRSSAVSLTLFLYCLTACSMRSPTVFASSIVTSTSRSKATVNLINISFDV